MWLRMEVWLCSWRAATFFMRCSHFYVQQLHSSVSVLSVCISVGYSRCCYADWLEPRSDSSTVTPILRRRPGLHSQKETFTALHFSIQRDSLYWAADVTQLYVLTWIIQETAMKTEWSHRKPACKTEVMHTIVQLSVQWNRMCCTVIS